jgi:hypothetical protein
MVNCFFDGQKTVAVFVDGAKLNSRLKDGTTKNF